MKTVCYYEIIRRKDKFKKIIWAPVIILFVLFLVSLLIDAFFPMINRDYMKWPDMLKDLISLPSWNSNLYVNLWQIFAIIYSIIYIVNITTGLANSIIEEERLETVVYLHNLSVDRTQILLSKGSVWVGVNCIHAILLLVENAIFFLILGADNMIAMLVEFVASLLVVTLIYMVFATFLASYKKQEASCDDTISTVVIFSLLIARLYALIQFLSDIFVATGREGVITERMDIIADKLRILGIVAPVTWCWPGVAVRGVYVICGILVTIVLGIAAILIYRQRMFMDEE